MKRQMQVVRLVVVLAVVMFVVAGLQAQGASAADKVYRLKIQSAFPHGDLSMDTLKVFADSAEKRSDGRLQIKVFADPEIVPGDQLFGATQQGVVDMLQAMGGMWAGMVPIGSVEFNLPLAFRIDEEESFEGKAAVVRDFYFNKGFIELLRAEYAKQGLYLLDIHTYGPVPFVLSKKDAKSCADLKGMKIRAEGINLAYHNGVGMQGTVISGLETYMALKLGTVDAAEWDLSAVTGLKWHEVAPYWIRGMECDHTTGHILFNLKKWDALPDDLKEALRGAAEDYWHATVKAYGRELGTIAALVKEGQLKENMLDEACRAEYAAAAQKIWKDLADQDPASAKAIEMIKAWRGMP